MNDQDRLTQTLERRAQRMGPGQPTTLDDVKGRARGIRRRRLAVSGLTTAAVLAVAVPTAIALERDATHGPSAPPASPVIQSASPPSEPHMTPSSGLGPSPSSSPSLTAVPPAPPGGVKKVVLTTQAQSRSGEPGIPFLFDGVINRPDGSTVPAAKDYDAVVPLGAGWVTHGVDGRGNGFVDVLDASGKVTATRPSSGGLAVSADGTLVAFAGDDGALYTLVAGGQPQQLVAADAARTDVDPVAVIGSGACGGSSPEACTVYFDALVNGQRHGMSAAPDGTVHLVGTVLAVSGAAADGSLTALASTSGTGSCSVLLRPDGSKGWETCDYTLGQFSADGQYVLGHPAYQDGAGDSSLAILDAATGNPLVDFGATAATQAFIDKAVWDTDDTALATVWEKDGWALMRMAPDGSLTSVSAGGLANGRNPDVVPLHFSVRP
jgi:hypothetical protein